MKEGGVSVKGRGVSVKEGGECEGKVCVKGRGVSVKGEE